MVRLEVCDSVPLREGVPAERVALGLDVALREADTDPVGWSEALPVSVRLEVPEAVVETNPENDRVLLPKVSELLCDRRSERVWLCLCAVDDPSTGSACDDPKLSPNDAALDTSSRPTCRRAAAHPDGQSSRWNVSAPSGSWCGPPNGPAAMHVRQPQRGSV
jgi:hypothetical protein